MNGGQGEEGKAFRRLQDGQEVQAGCRGREARTEDVSLGEGRSLENSWICRRGWRDGGEEPGAEGSSEETEMPKGGNSRVWLQDGWVPHGERSRSFLGRRSLKFILETLKSSLMS